MDLRTALDITARKDARGNPVPFSIHFTTLDNSRRNKPSKHMHFEQAVRCGAAHNLVQHDQIGVKPVDGSHPQVAVHLDLIERINGEEVI